MHAEAVTSLCGNPAACRHHPAQHVPHRSPGRRADSRRLAQFGFGSDANEPAAPPPTAPPALDPLGAAPEPEGPPGFSLPGSSALSPEGVALPPGASALPPGFARPPGEAEEEALGSAPGTQTGLPEDSARSCLGGAAVLAVATAAAALTAVA